MSFLWRNWSSGYFAAKTAILAANTLFFIEIAAKWGVSAANTLMYYEIAARLGVSAANTLMYYEIAAKWGVSAANTLIFIGFAALEADSAAISNSPVSIRSLAQLIAQNILHVLTRRIFQTDQPMLLLLLYL